MGFGAVTHIRHHGSTLSADDAARVIEQALDLDRAAVVLLDLRQTTETTTPALARLILLRRRLLRSGRDLLIVGLAGRAEALYRIARIEKILPRTELPRRVWRRAGRAVRNAGSSLGQLRSGAFRSAHDVPQPGGSAVELETTAKA